MSGRRSMQKKRTLRAAYPNTFLTNVSNGEHRCDDASRSVGYDAADGQCLRIRRTHGTRVRRELESTGSGNQTVAAQSYQLWSVDGPRGELMPKFGPSRHERRFVEARSSSSPRPASLAVARRGLHRNMPDPSTGRESRRRG
jgi:hypothetical protein